MPANLIAIVGPDAATALSLAIGGAAITVPKSVGSPAGQALAGIIGVDAAVALIEKFGGKQVYIRRDAQAERIKRLIEIRDLRRQGKTLAEISRDYRYTSRLTIRQIQTILKGLDT